MRRHRRVALARGHGHGRRRRRQVPAALRLRRLAGRAPRVGVVVPGARLAVRPERRERAAARPAHLPARTSRSTTRPTSYASGSPRASSPPSGPRPGHATAALVGAWLGFDVDDGSFELPSDPQALRDQGTEALGEYFRDLSRAGAGGDAARGPALGRRGHAALARRGRSGPRRVARCWWWPRRDPRCWRTTHAGAKGLAHHVRLTLNPLSRRESRELVRQILQPGRGAPRRAGRPRHRQRRGQPVLHRGAGHLADRRRGRRPRSNRTGSSSTSWCARSPYPPRSRACSSRGSTR